jgi:hypothetical protein
VIDIEDLPKAQSIPGRWYAQYRHHRGTYYVAGGLGDGDKKVLLHRLLTDCPEGMVVDHQNHDTLDNRRKSNLKVCTNQENLQNKKGSEYTEDLFTIYKNGQLWLGKDNKPRTYMTYPNAVKALQQVHDDIRQYEVIPYTPKEESR